MKMRSKNFTFFSLVLAFASALAAQNQKKSSKDLAAEVDRAIGTAESVGIGPNVSHR